MYRSILIIAGLAVTVPPAFARDATINSYPLAGGLSWPGISDFHTGVPASQRYLRLTTWEADQLLRWSAVGQCVAARDHDASVAYIAAERGSPDAIAAAKRLDPAFAACLTGSRIVAPGNKDYRRAALADALRIGGRAD